MKFRTKIVPSIRFCVNCPFRREVTTVIISGNHHKESRCRHDELEADKKYLNPLHNLEKDAYFPEWCPLEEGEIVDI